MKRAQTETPDETSEDELTRIKKQATDSSRPGLTRSQLMRLNADRLEKFNGKEFELGKQKYPAITHSTFFSGKLVSVSGDVDTRDIILFDSDSKELDGYYQRFLELHRGKEYTLENFLQELYKFVRKPLASAKSSESLTGDYPKMVSARGKTVSLIPLEFFIVNKTKNCCVYALFCSYLLNHLIKNGILPAGRVHLNRDEVVGVKAKGLHAWVIYKLDNGTIYLLDCATFAPKHVVEFLSDVDYVKENYGEEALLEMVRRYVDLSDVASLELSGESTQPLSEESTLPLSYSSE